jgi:hypothetical protein
MWRLVNFVEVTMENRPAMAGAMVGFRIHAGGIAIGFFQTEKP